MLIWFIFSGDIESVQSIRKAIWHEVHVMSKLLRDRRYSLSGGPDLASLTNLSVVQMVCSCFTNISSEVTYQGEICIKGLLLLLL